jgi:hypothetical protein
MQIGLSAFIFFAAVYGLSNAIAVLKIGRYFIGQGMCFEKDCTALDHPLDKRRGLGVIPYLGDLLYCPPCLSFWIGIGVSLVLVSPASFVTLSRPGAVLLDGLSACAVSYVLHVVMERAGHGVETL